MNMKMMQETEPAISEARVKILLINPNSSREMTAGLDKLIEGLGYSKDTKFTTYTAPPQSPDSINNEDDADISAEVVLADPELPNLLEEHSAILVCCYSVHPLVSLLRSRVPTTKPVTGIFEASISVSMSVLQTKSSSTSCPSFSTFGIVSTGKYWEHALSSGVHQYLGYEAEAGRLEQGRFAGVRTTGLSAGELHTCPPEEVERKMIEATRLLVRGGKVGVVCLGCAGMAGMDILVRRACIQELGDDDGKSVWIVDGVKAGIALLDGLVRGRGA